MHFICSIRDLEQVIVLFNKKRHVTVRKSSSVENARYEQEKVVL